MATLKIKLRVFDTNPTEGRVFYQVIHRRCARQQTTRYRLRVNEWNEAASDIVVPSTATPERTHVLERMREHIAADARQFQYIIGRLEAEGAPYTAKDVIDRFFATAGGNGFLSFTRLLIEQLIESGRERTAETYTKARNSFRRFTDGRDVALDSIDSNMIATYETYLRSRGVCPNTSSYYMRNLRAIYNRAVDKEIIAQRHPFKHVYTGIDKTVKRAVPLRVMRQIKNLDLRRNASLAFARDIFLFSFYTRGMSFVDVAYLKKRDLQNGVLTYRRQKTGQQLFIKWEKPMQDIVTRYGQPHSPYLLPLISRPGEDERRQYVNAIHLINKKLHQIGYMLGLTAPLTTYVARHGWASIAKSKNIPISTISEAMGHDSENTTRIYLAALDTAIVDRANNVVIRSL